MTVFENIKKTVIKGKVFENYFYMTSLQIFSSLIGIFIYPYLIRTLGKESYGLYAFAFSITTFFIIFIAFGFNFPSMRRILECKDDLASKSEIVSSVFTAKCYLTLLATIIFGSLVIFIPILRENWLVFFLCYGQVLTQLFFPSWYFQAVQKMKIVTYIQLAFRLLTIPFILLFVKTTDQTWLYALIVLISVLLGAMTAAYILRYSEQIKLRLVPFRLVKEYCKESLPFFWSNALGTAKQETITIIIGSFMSMGDVALYDLANKIIVIPRMLTNNINAAIFPKAIENLQIEKIKKIFRYERIISLFVMAIVILFGYWAILLLGGKSMIASYPMAVILSTSIYTWLIVGCYISYIFVPQGRYYFVTKNQIIALCSFLFFCGIGLIIYKSMLLIVSAYAISGIFELIYCRYITRKYRLL